jgi:uncharacterized heparinase superfamily protein
VQRRLRLQVIDPLLAPILYPRTSLTSETPSDAKVKCLLADLAALHATAPDAKGFDTQSKHLRLLNQTPIPLMIPMAWEGYDFGNPLSQIRLHSWEWLWPLLRVEAQSSFIQSLWRDWVIHVAPGRGLAWEPYTTSRHLTVWCTAWHLIDGDQMLKGAILQNPAFLAEHLERDLDNNHLVANAKALAWVGMLFPDYPKAKQWQRIGLNLLRSALADQVRSDGGHIENSTSYHTAVLVYGLETALLCKVCGQHVPVQVIERLRKMTHFAESLLRPDGRLPLLNNSVEDEPLPWLPVCKLADRLTTAIEYGWTGNDNHKVTMEENGVFADSGYAVLKTRDNAEGTFLVFDCGDLGPDFCPGHGHADALSCGRRENH